MTTTASRRKRMSNFQAGDHVQWTSRRKDDQGSRVRTGVVIGITRMGSAVIQPDKHGPRVIQGINMLRGISPYTPRPEHDKLHKVRRDAEKIAGFLKWWQDKKDLEEEVRELILQYLGVDLAELEREKQIMKEEENERPTP
jgi:hypothetical protein